MNLFRSITAAVSVAGTLFFVAAFVANPARAQGPYQGYIAIDAGSGQVLLEDKADVVTPPASMTKLMTFAVLHDKIRSGALSEQTVVQVTAADARMGGTQVYLDPREAFSVEDLIYAMMIQSANDASHALARAAGGSVGAFVDLMNAKARELGMTRTSFRTPHGLPPSSRRNADGDLTTPRDFALLCRYLVMNTDVLKYTSVSARDFGLARKQGPIHMRNHNNLLNRVVGVDGLKTGYTSSAGYCLSVTAMRDGRRVIAVIMGAFGKNGEIDRGKSRDLRAIDLVERAFVALPPGAMFTRATEVGRPVEDPIPTVRTERSAPREQASTAESEPFKFRLNLPEQKK